MPLFQDKFPNRVEELRIDMVLSKSATENHRENLSHLPMVVPSPEAVLEGDVVNLNYKFCVQYFGNVVRALRAVTRICADPDVVVSATVEELVHGECVIGEVLEALRQVQQTIKARDAQPQST